jgi:hypothetical protein
MKRDWSYQSVGRLLAILAIMQARALHALPAAPADSSFEIYYVAGSAGKTVVKLDTVPFINLADIKQYDYAHHTIVLEREASDHFVRAIPQVIGNAFIVFVNHQAVYGGRFWPLRDQTYTGPYIELREIVSAPDTTPNYKFKIRLLCKDEVCRDADDPRLDRRVQDVFRKAKKLSLTK